MAPSSRGKWELWAIRPSSGALHRAPTRALSSSESPAHSVWTDGSFLLPCFAAPSPLSLLLGIALQKDIPACKFKNQSTAFLGENQKDTLFELFF